MPFSVGIHPPKTPVTDGNQTKAKNTIPNVCKMPGPPAPFVPAPLPNIGKSSLSPKDFSTSVKIEGHTVAIRGATFESMGDMASKGTGGGLISANTHGPTKFIAPGSMTVKIEGKNVHLLAEPMLNNCGPSGSPPNTGATMMGNEHDESEKGENCTHPNPKAKEVPDTRDADIAAAQQRLKDAKAAEQTAKQEAAAAKKILETPYKLRGKVKISNVQVGKMIEKAEAAVATAKDSAQKALNDIKGKFNERKVSEDCGGSKSYKIVCANDHVLQEFDVVTDDGRAKEVKSSEGGFNKGKFDDKAKFLSLVPGAKVMKLAIRNPQSAAMNANVVSAHPDMAGKTQDH